MRKIRGLFLGLSSLSLLWVSGCFYRPRDNNKATETRPEKKDQIAFLDEPMPRPSENGTGNKYQVQREREELERKKYEEGIQRELEKEGKRKQEVEQKQAEMQKRESKAREYVDSAVHQILGQLGGGQDLVWDFKRSDDPNAFKFQFDEIARRFTIDIAVHYRGAIKRGNEYSFEGRLIVNESGSNPKFSVTTASPEFNKVQNRLSWVGVAVGTYILYDLSKKR